MYIVVPRRANALKQWIAVYIIKKCIKTLLNEYARVGTRRSLGENLSVICVTLCIMARAVTCVTICVGSAVCYAGGSRCYMRRNSGAGLRI